jgi:hypothetical protein
MISNDAISWACEREQVSTIESFKEYFDDVDNIFLEYYLPCKLESKMTW